MSYMEQVECLGDGNTCPECGSKKITVHEQRNLQVDVNLSTGRPFKVVNGKIKDLCNRDKATAFNYADISNGGSCWNYECRKCGWTSEIFTE